MRWARSSRRGRACVREASHRTGTSPRSRSPGGAASAITAADRIWRRLRSNWPTKASSWPLRFLPSSPSEASQSARCSWLVGLPTSIRTFGWSRPAIGSLPDSSTRPRRRSASAAALPRAASSDGRSTGSMSSRKADPARADSRSQSRPSSAISAADPGNASTRNRSSGMPSRRHAASATLVLVARSGPQSCTIGGRPSESDQSRAIRSTASDWEGVTSPCVWTASTTPSSRSSCSWMPAR